MKRDVSGLEVPWMRALLVKLSLERTALGVSRAARVRADESRVVCVEGAIVW